MLSKILNENSFPVFFISPRFRFLRHFLFILFFLVVSFSGNNSERQYVGASEFIIKFGFIVICLGIIYFNMYVLVPKILFKDKYWLYFVAVFLLMAFAFLMLIPAERFISKYRIEPVERESLSFWLVFLIFVFNLGVFIAASTAIKLLQKWMTDSQKINDLEKLTMQVELEQLKNQINPHFLFNMLNNVNVLILRDPKKASHVLLVLSDLLRYQLYDTSRAKVLLTADISFINDFLNLENIRRDNFSFNVTSEGEIENVLIAPLLFIPFVENATKHNDFGENGSYVNIHFLLQHNVLNFHCENSKSNYSSAKKEKGGLGLSNIKRRLELLYPDTHELLVQDNETNYVVNLSIRL